MRLIINFHFRDQNLKEDLFLEEALHLLSFTVQGKHGLGSTPLNRRKFTKIHLR